MKQSPEHSDGHGSEGDSQIDNNGDENATEGTEGEGGPESTTQVESGNGPESTTQVESGNGPESTTQVESGNGLESADGTDANGQTENDGDTVVTTDGGDSGDAIYNHAPDFTSGEHWGLYFGMILPLSLIGMTAAYRNVKGSWTNEENQNSIAWTQERST